MYQIPIDYNKYFKDRVIIITGVGRSGTTILGKIVGSMQNCYYLFEPAFMKFFPPYFISKFMAATIFEDHLLPLVQGRNLNWNPSDDSFYGHYMTTEQVFNAWKDLSRRSQAIKYIEEHKPLWIIKSNEIAGYKTWQAQFPGIRFIYIIRNGLEVISSAIKKGWYTDGYMANQIIDYVDNNGINVPWYLSEEDKLNWIEWDQVTRCACVWRTLVEKSPILPLRYEELISTPEIVIEIYGIIPTDLTWSHIESIKNHPKIEHALTLNDIQEPEKEKFKATMERFGYEV